MFDDILVVAVALAIGYIGWFVTQSYLAVGIYAVIATLWLWHRLTR